MTMILDGTNGAFLPTWTTATRPASPANGEIGYNSTTGQLDQYVGSAWSSVPTAGASQATATALGTVYASTLDVSGNATTAVGYQALRVNTGSSNVALGATALYTNTSGARNVAVGYGTLYTNNGNENVGIGVAALQLNTSGYYNVAVGYQALQSNTTTSACVAVGYQALYSNSSQYNTAVGHGAGSSMSTGGGENVFVGYTAGNNNATGTSNIYVGSSCRASSTSVNYEFVFAQYLTGKGTGTFYVGGLNGSYNQANSAYWSVTSDQRLKKNIIDNTVGLEAINGIRVRNFEYRTKDEVTDLPEHTVIEKSGIQLGVIAQELQQVLPDCVTEQSTGVLSVDSDNIMWHMINAVKELSAELNALKAKVGV